MNLDCLFLKLYLATLTVMALANRTADYIKNQLRKNYYKSCICSLTSGKNIFIGGDCNMKQKERPDDFPQELAEVIEDGNKHGVNDELMVKGMVSLGNLMAKFVKPDTPEEALMSEMWELATDDEKNMMANLVLKIGKKRLQQKH